MGKIASTDRKAHGAPLGMAAANQQQPKVALTKEELAEFKSEFNEVDTDQSGSIDVDEVRQLLKIQLDRDPSQDEVEAMLHAFDQNQDGKVTFEEYMSTLCGEGW